jgi:hypothetical protein
MLCWLTLSVWSKLSIRKGEKSPTLLSGYPTFTYSRVLSSHPWYDLASIGSGGAAINVLVDGLRTVEDRAVRDYCVDNYSGTAVGVVGARGELAVARYAKRTEMVFTGEYGKTCMWTAGRWMAFKSLDDSKALVIDTGSSGIERRAKEEYLRVVAFADCAQITGECSSMNSTLVYCLEKTASEVYLIYYTMPSCTRARFTSRITQNIDQAAKVSLNVQEELLGICSAVTAPGSVITTNCKVYDTRTDLFVLENPDKAKPVKESILSLTLPNLDSILHIQLITKLGTVIIVAKTTDGKYQVIAQGLSETINLSGYEVLSTDPLDSPPLSLNWNDAENYLTFASAFRIHFAAFTEMNLSSRPEHCEVFNYQYSTCARCATNSRLVEEGTCSPPSKQLLPVTDYRLSMHNHILYIEYALPPGSEDHINANTQSMDFLSFSSSEVLDKYEVKLIPASRELFKFQRQRIVFLPKQSAESIDTDIGIMMFRRTRVLQRSQLHINPCYLMTAGVRQSFTTLFGYFYTLVFFLQLYLVLLRPWVEKWRRDPAQMWLTHFVLAAQSMSLLGFNSLDLKGFLGDFLGTAAVSSFRFVSYDPEFDLSQGKDNFRSGYFLGKFTSLGATPVLIQELFHFFVIYILTTLFSIFLPFWREQFRCMRITSLLCYLPQFLFMFFISTLNLFGSKNYTQYSYVSFIMPLFMNLVIVSDLIYALVPRARELCFSVFAYPNDEANLMYDVLEYSLASKVNPLTHADILTYIVSSILLGCTPLSGTLQASLLFVLYFLTTLSNFQQLASTPADTPAQLANKALRRLRFFHSAALFMLALLLLITHTKVNNLEGIRILAVFAVIVYLFAYLLLFLALLNRLSHLFAQQLPYSAGTTKIRGVKVLISGAQDADASDSANKQVSVELANQTGKLHGNSILTRYLGEQSRVYEADTRLVDHSILPKLIK